LRAWDGVVQQKAYEIGLGDGSSNMMWPLVVYFVLVLLLVAVMLLVSHVLGQRHLSPATASPYEAGIVSEGSARLRFSANFYLIAMFFVVFDVEAVILFSWAIAARESGWAGFWDAAIFARAGLERIDLRPPMSITLDWMLPAPAQGAIVAVCRENDQFAHDACRHFNDEETERCTRIERDFLRKLLGGCSTPISALAEIKGSQVHFKGNILSLDGREKVEIEKVVEAKNSTNLGKLAAEDLLAQGGEEIAEEIRHATK